MPATEDDFDELFNRLGMIGNATSEIVLTEYEIDQLYDNMVDQNDEELSIEIDGKIYDNYADLVELEKE